MVRMVWSLWVRIPSRSSCRTLDPLYCTFRRSGWDGWWLTHHFKGLYGISINGGTPTWMAYYRKSNDNGWFGGTPISENLHVCVHEHFWYTCIPRNGQSPVGAMVGSKPPESETDIFLASKGRSFTTYGGVTSGWCPQKVMFEEDQEICCGRSVATSNTLVNIDLMGFHWYDLMGFNGDLMGFNGDLMRFNRI